MGYLIGNCSYLIVDNRTDQLIKCWVSVLSMSICVCWNPLVAGCSDNYNQSIKFFFFPWVGKCFATNQSRSDSKSPLDFSLLSVELPLTEVCVVCYMDRRRRHQTCFSVILAFDRQTYIQFRVFYCEHSLNEFYVLKKTFFSRLLL